jgi:hypothetical protein
MQKIPSLFKRDYEGTRQVYDEVVPGCEWVLAGEGVATVKWDGTCCRVDAEGRLWKRYDRKPTRAAYRRGKPYQSAEDFKPAPDGWEAAEPAPNLHTGHWPGWVPVGDGPEDKWHRAGFAYARAMGDPLQPGTYELVGPKVNGGPHWDAWPNQHTLVRHGQMHTWADPRTFGEALDYLQREPTMEGIVWHHPDGRMAKIKRRDFGLPWPPARTA